MAPLRPTTFFWWFLYFSSHAFAPSFSCHWVHFQLELLFHSLHEVIMATANFIVSKYNELSACFFVVVVVVHVHAQFSISTEPNIPTSNRMVKTLSHRMHGAMFSLTWLKLGGGLFNAENKTDLFSLGNQQRKYIKCLKCTECFTLNRISPSAIPMKCADVHVQFNAWLP